MQVSSRGDKTEGELQKGEVENIELNESEGPQQTGTTIMPISKETIAKQQSGVPDSKCCCLLSRKAKIIIASISIFIILLTIGLSVGLTLALKPKVIDVKPSSQFFFDQDKSILRLTEITVQDKNLFEPNLKFTVYKSEAVAPGGRRLLQQGNSSIIYTNTVNFEQEGIIARVFPDNSAQIMVDPEQLISYLNSTDDQVPRMLQQIDESNLAQQTETNDNDWKELQAELSKALSSEMNKGKQVNFQDLSYVTLQFNPESKVFEQIEDQNSSNKRLLLQKRILFIKLFKKVVNVVKKVVKPVVKAVRVAGPVVGAATGAAIGFAIGGPAVAFQGAKMGYEIGSLAQTAVKACVPNNSLRIKCDKKIVLKEVKQQAKMWVVKQLTGFNDWFDNWNPFMKK